LVGDELVEVGVGEHATSALRAMANGNVAKRTGLDEAVERLDGAA
jgi:hypothetical protein